MVSKKNTLYAQMILFIIGYKMKKITKILLITIGFSMALYANNYNETITKTIRDTTKMDIKVIDVYDLKSVNLRFIIAQIPDERRIPFYSTINGKSFIGFSGALYFSNAEDMQTIQKSLTNLKVYNNNIAKKKVKIQIPKLLNSLPKESFIYINADIKTNKLLTIVTDPDCPFCKKELSALSKHLKTTNVRLIFAPVHTEKAYIKSQLIMDELKDVKPNEKDKIIAVLTKYYKNIPLTKEQLQTKTTLVHENANKIFGSRIIKGVPYLYESEIR